MSVVKISKLAGVSIATVSRVINNNPQVSPQSVDAVRRAILEIGYTPPPPNQRFRGRPRKDSQSTGIQRGYVALLFPDSRDQAMRTALSGRLMQGATQGLMPEHLNMLATVLQADGELPLCIRNRQVDGVIVRGSVDVSAIAPKLRGIPCVWLLELNQLPGHGDQVLEDTDALGEMAAASLIGRGYKRLAVINPDPNHPCYRKRTEAFISAVKDSASVEVIAGFSAEESIAKLLSMNPRPTGLFLPPPDTELVEIYRALVAHGVQPGRDIGWLGCSYDPPRLAALDPLLPNLDIQPEQIAHAATEMLLWRLANPYEPRRRLMIMPRLVEPAILGSLRS